MMSLPNFFTVCVSLTSLPDFNEITPNYRAYYNLQVGGKRGIYKLGHLEGTHSLGILSGRFLRANM